MQIFIGFLISAFLCLTSAVADDTKNLRFGVLSFRPKEITTAQWAPLVQELRRVLSPDYTVELLVMTYPELDKAAREKQLDFVLTNPEHYILLKNVSAMNAIATMVTIEKGHPLTHFAGVIFARADRIDIQTLEDLNNKTIASPSEQSLGGYLMQHWELEKIGITTPKYIFTGMPHDKAVEVVLAGGADAGFVRSGVLEKLAEAGKINLADVRVLAPHTPVDEETIPVLHSTEHYPEWPFGISRHVSLDISRKVSLALLNIKSNSELAKKVGIAGFNPPADYTPIEILMLRSRAHPDELKYFSFNDVVWRYREFVVIGTVFVLLILILLVFLVLSNRRFKRVANENKKLLLAVEQSPVSVVITDLEARIQYVNQAFCKTTGYAQKEVIGQNPRVLKSNKNTQHLYDEMWGALANGKEWRGEMINCRKDGSEYIESTFIAPVREIDGTVRHYLAVKEDITERKKAEELIRQLAFYDSLTGLPNRRKLLERLNYAIALSHREGRHFAVFMMDLDKFKAVNDKLGHAAGDDLLKQVAARIPLNLRDCDLVARLGGDEFVILLENLHHFDDAEQVALKVITHLSEPFELSNGEVVQIGASIGISFYPQHGDNPEKLIDHADTALYLAKDKGRGCFSYYS